ncbi:hypothetical protein BDV96DRAFT_29310 [Lophiotrema nucula]|uniref:NACHT-NTPase and P-loop NTPases N-terminal domain-containing protein n=1 Tax=Lophiotrema nucula TaxID=690887 RepID=A0A6A5ZBE4_9PLEO|nr:hypothetical protein BDV96DRAFT_29310 [Lophiotrema nucula]
MEPLVALGAASSVLQIVDFSCKVLSKGNQFRASFAGVLPENKPLKKATEHLYGLIVRLQGQALNSMIILCIQTAEELLDVLEKLKVYTSKTR